MADETTERAQSGPDAGFSPRAADAAAREADPFAERPELFVGGAFVGGLALAILLRTLGE